MKGAPLDLGAAQIQFAEEVQQRRTTPVMRHFEPGVGRQLGRYAAVRVLTQAQVQIAPRGEKGRAVIGTRRVINLAREVRRVWSLIGSESPSEGGADEGDRGGLPCKTSEYRVELTRGHLPSRAGHE